MKYINTVLICLAAVGSVACSAVKQCQAPQLNLPDNIAGRVDSLTVADVAWWEFYGDTILCRIIERTLSDNKNIRSAAARVEQMQQMYRISKANRLPNVSIGVLGDYETNDYYGEAPLRDPQFDLKATVRWEADLWGNLRWAKRKGESEYMATVEDERAMRMMLVAETASAYFRLVALDNELSIVRQTLDTRREGVAQAKLRFEGGLTSETVYQQAQVEYAATAALIPDLERQIEITENAISLLMGGYPDWEVVRGKMNVSEIRSEDLPVGIPSVLLQRRPDLRASEARLRAALAGVGIAYADRFPRLVFSLTGGLENDDIKGLLRSPFSYVAGTLAAPVFGFGRKKAAYKAQLAAYEQARLAYEQKVLEVFKETDDAIVSYRSAREAAQLKSDLCDAARKYVDLANLQYRAGSINYIDVLDAQRRYFNAQTGLSNAVRDEHLALVQLYKALGGGWQN
ncbi:MAG: efflux transporter outer membrane subunit [Alistipes sp.]|nr:efflux transporter outer membrane subunit [Alistipes sp.]